VKSFLKMIAAAGIVLFIAGAVFMGVLMRKTSKPLPVYGEVPAFQLFDQDSRRVTEQVFDGKITLVSFIFTSCPNICPTLTKWMAEIQKAKPLSSPPMQYLSISVDPETDSPKVLKDFGVKYGADFNQWSFLTGKPRDIESLVIRGFATALDRDAKDVMAITHSEKFVVVDATRQIRAYKNLNTLEERRELVEWLKNNRETLEFGGSSPR